MPDPENEHRPPTPLHERFGGAPAGAVPVMFDPTTIPDDRPARLIVGSPGWGKTIANLG